MTPGRPCLRFVLAGRPAGPPVALGRLQPPATVSSARGGPHGSAREDPIRRAFASAVKRVSRRTGSIATGTWPSRPATSISGSTPVEAAVRSRSTAARASVTALRRRALGPGLAIRRRTSVAEPRARRTPEAPPAPRAWTSRAVVRSAERLAEASRHGRRRSWPAWDRRRVAAFPPLRRTFAAGDRLEHLGAVEWPPGTGAEVIAAMCAEFWPKVAAPTFATGPDGSASGRLTPTSAVSASRSPPGATPRGPVQLAPVRRGRRVSVLGVEPEAGLGRLLLDHEEPARWGVTRSSVRSKPTNVRSGRGGPRTGRATERPVAGRPPRRHGVHHRVRQRRSSSPRTSSTSEPSSWPVERFPGGLRS